MIAIKKACANVRPELSHALEKLESSRCLDSYYRFTMFRDDHLDAFAASKFES